jgi:hypothetical protein
MQMDPLQKEPITQDFARLVKLVVGQPRPDQQVAHAARTSSWKQKLPFLRRAA